MTKSNELKTDTKEMQSGITAKEEQIQEMQTQQQVCEIDYGKPLACIIIGVDQLNHLGRANDVVLGWQHLQRELQLAQERLQRLNVKKAAVQETAERQLNTAQHGQYTQ